TPLPYCKLCAVLGALFVCGSTYLGTLKNKTSPFLWYTPGKACLEEWPWNSRTHASRCSSRQRNRSRAAPDGCLWPAPSKNWGPGDNGAQNGNSGGAA